MRNLLHSDERLAYEQAAAMSDVHRVAGLATIGVSTVTGANSFFCYDTKTRNEGDLQSVSRTLLPRTSDALGIAFTAKDHSALSAGERPAWMLDANTPDREANPCLAEYLRRGEASSLPARYKCRIRTPWFRVPIVAPRPLLLSKRAHLFPRLILNQAEAVTTDTIYQGTPKPGRDASRIVANFHTTLTCLSAELEGRSYGGGVLELIPSELGRLAVVDWLPATELGGLDEVSRASGGQRDKECHLVDATDALCVATRPAYGEILPLLRAGWHRLREFRHTGVNFEADSPDGA